MIRKMLLSLVVISMLIMPGVVKADTVSMTLTGVDGQIDHYYYIDPYYATVDGKEKTQIWCVDFNHHVNIGDSWTANVTSVNSVAANDNTYLHNLATYQKMVYLVQQYLSLKKDASLDDNQAAIQWVIWDLSSGQNHSSYYGTLYDHWMGLARDNFASGNYSGWVILTDVNRTKQEFVTYVPEPGTMLLLGFGLVALGFAVRRESAKCL